jgi:hypothetical protein
MKAIVGMTLMVFVLAGAVYAKEGIEISGMRIPVVEDARLESKGRGDKINARVAVYKTARPLDEVVNFYERFLKEHDFLIMGGTDENGNFDVSVKKENTQFSLRIYAQEGETVIQFIW